MNFDAIIIGGGLGGLTAGATLARFRKKILLEQHHIPGGCATTLKRNDYIMEVFRLNPDARTKAVSNGPSSI